MKQFLKKIGLYSLAVLILNIAFGFYLRSYETVDLKSKKAFFPEMRWEDYYELTDSIDVLVLGSSHAYQSYDPVVMEPALDNRMVFNFGSSAQSPVTSYYILDAVLEQHRPQMIILDIYVMVFTPDELNNNGRINLLSMKWDKSKWKFFKEGFSLREKIILTLFPTYIYRGYLKYKIKKLLGRRYIKPDSSVYEKNGFVSHADTLSQEALQYGNQFSRFEIDMNTITNKNIGYLKKIKERCDKANIPLVFMSAPMPDASIGHIENYSEIFKLFDEEAKTLGVPYFDFNQDRIPAIKDEFHFYDDDHMNMAGATIYTKEVARLLLEIEFGQTLKRTQH